MDEFSEPEPDIAVVPGHVRDYVDQHPSTALLIVEVADSSLRFDCGDKAHAYARNAIPDYWVLNLRDRVLVVHREPEDGIYRAITTVQADQRVAPLSAPACSVAVADLLP